MEPSAFVCRVADRLHSDERHAEVIIRLVFQELRDGLTEAGASDVAMHLPPLVQPLWMPNEQLSLAGEQPYRLELLGTVMQAGAFPDSSEAERAVVAVFTALQDVLDRVTGTTRVVRDILGQLPQELKILWTAAERGRRAIPPRRRADPLIAPSRTRRATQFSAA